MDRKVQLAVKRLDDLIQKLEDYKPLLDQNVTCAEFEIRANFNSLMEFLSERQGSLLKQLENIAREKALLIESNVQTLESLRAAIVSSQTTKKDVDSKIPEYINKVESIVLNESLTPFVTFRAESNRLKQSVSTYGRLASRYPGHFEDPSQPSACLPRALEEEDDHDLNPAHSAVLGRAVNSCPCTDPKLRQWLSLSDHHCKYEKPKIESGDNYSISSESSHHHGHTIGSLTEQAAKLDISPALSSVHIPYYPLKSTTVRKWLELRDDKPSSLKRPSTISMPSTLTNTSLPRMLNPSQNEFSGVPSSSFDVLTESSIATNLKDWLFCDSMELSDMPGLATAINCRTCPTLKPKPQTQVERPAESVTIPKAAVPDPIQTGSLFPSHLLPECSLDLNLWLRPRDTNPTASEPTASSQHSSEQHRDSEMDTTTVADCPIQKSDCPNSQSCPLYGQCPSGPGGPTCCATRFTVPAPNVMDVFPICPNPTEPMDEYGDRLKSADPEPNPKLTTTPFDRIAATDLKLWISPDTSGLSEYRKPADLDHFGPDSTLTMDSLAKFSPIHSLVANK